jgi:hypothetical protein
MDIKYRKVIDEYGEYYIPDFEDDEVDADVAAGSGADNGDITNNDSEYGNDAWIGKYGMLRFTYLKNHRRGTYGTLLATGKLHEHLMDVEKQATDFFRRVVPELAKSRGITEELKAADQMKWVGMMNNVTNAVDEMIFAEIIYV